MYLNRIGRTSRIRSYSRWLLVLVAISLSSITYAATFNISTSELTVNLSWSNSLATYAELYENGARVGPLYDKTDSIQLTRTPGTYTYEIRFTTIIGGNSYGPPTYQITKLTRTVTVTTPNTYPAIGAIANKAIDQGSWVGSVSFSVSDQETSASQLSVTAVSSNTSVIPASALSLSGSGSTRTLAINHTANVPGYSSIKLTVSDGALTTNKTFQVMVRDLPASISAPATSTGTYTVLWKNAIDKVRILENGVFKHSSFDADGSISITKTVNGTFRYDIEDCTYDGGVDGPIGGGTGGPIGGPATFTCVRTDFTEVTVDLPNPTVTISLGSASINEAGTTTISWSSTRANSCSGSGISGVAGTSGSVNYTAPSVMSSEMTKTFTITCMGAGGSTSESVSLSVLAVNDAPHISSIASRFTSEDSSIGGIGFTVSDEETSAGLLTVSASSNNSALIQALTLGGSGGSRTISVIPVANKSGQVTVTVTVRDPSGVNRSRSFLVTVLPVNDGPLLSEVSDISIDQGETAQIDVHVSDIDDAASSLNVAAQSSNPSLLTSSEIAISAINSGSSRRLILNPGKRAAGTALITITVSDGALSHQQTLNLEVVAAQPAVITAQSGDKTDSVNSNGVAREVRYIHTDLLGSPVAETE